MQIEANGHLRLTINEAWLPKKGHRLVPWPPPRTSGGHIVLALYVFLHGTNDEGHYTDIALEGLYRLTPTLNGVCCMPWIVSISI